VAYLALAGVLTRELLHVRARGLERSCARLSVFGLVGAVALVGLAVYPRVDALREIGRGSDRDDALIVAATSWIEVGTPYAHTTYLGNELSPGPGWIALVAPLSLSGAYGLSSAIALGITVGVARSVGHRWEEVLVFAALVLGNGAALELVATGADFLPLGLLLLAVTLRLLATTRTLEVAPLAVVVGLLATARVVFGYWPLLLGFALWPLSRRRAAWVSGVGVAVVLLAHGWGAATSPGGYPPLHVLHKLARFDADASPIGEAITLGVSGATGALLLLRARAWSPLVRVTLGVVGPLLAAALGDLYVRRELAHAIFPGLVLLGAPLVVGGWMWPSRASA
jgi:hypothetical protein